MFFRMEEFFEEFLNLDRISLVQFLDTFIQPTLVLGYYITLIQRCDGIAVFTETLLYAISDFMKNDSIYSVLGLVLEFLNLAIVYTFPTVVASLGVAYIMLQAAAFDSALGRHDFINIRTKCTLFLALSAVGMPERLVCLIWIFKLTYDYLFNFQKKSAEDLFLIFLVGDVLLVNFILPAADPYAVAYVAAAYFWVIVWIILKCNLIGGPQ